MRFLYSESGFIGWHSPLITTRNLDLWEGKVVAEAVVTGRVSKKSGRVEPLMFGESVEKMLGGYSEDVQGTVDQFEDMFKAYGKALVKSRQAPIYNKTVMQIISVEEDYVMLWRNE